jgi:transposase
VISTKPGLHRYLRVTPQGCCASTTPRSRPKPTWTAIPAALQRPHLSAEDIALGYKQLLQVERGWRDMKQVIDLRPVYHRKEERIARTSCCAGWRCC